MTGSIKQPNIILINCDDLGYGDLGCYGSEKNDTPALDRMANEGIRFTDFYMAAPLCTPSRGAMMTGCYPKRIGFGFFETQGVLFPGQAIGLNPDEKSMAAVLKDAGYSTMLVGKWHCGDQPEFLPTRHGFDHYYGLPFSNDMGRQCGDNKPSFNPLPLMQDEEVIQQQPDQASLTERYVEKACNFIRENKENPFFLYFAHFYVHLPLFVPQRFLENSKNGTYGGAVACIDWVTDVLLHELRTQGLDENTLVVFTSDNGSNCRNGGSNAPCRGAKGSTLEGGQRLPCIARWPGTIKPGQTCDKITSALDFLPTFAGLAGANVPDDRIIDGVNLSSLLLDPASEASPRDTFFYYQANKLDAVRHKQWKLHLWCNELYDLSDDIGESNNIYDHHPQIVAELTALADTIRADIGDEATGIQGINCRPIGRVENPRNLTEYDPNYPYIIAMYDLEKGM